MIVLITYTEKGKVLVSHGVDYETMRNVVLPNESPQILGAKFNNELCEWVLED